MTLPNISTLTIAELEQLIQNSSSAISQKMQEEQTERESAKVELRTAHDAITALIGPDAPTAAGLDSYTEIQLYNDAQIQGNLVLAIRRILQGAELQARIMRDIVKAFVD